jgi:hypothetical protein
VENLGAFKVGRKIMETFDAQSLIHHWSSIQAAVASPHDSLTSELSTEEEINTLRMVTEPRERWEFYVSTSAYLDVMPTVSPSLLFDDLREQRLTPEVSSLMNVISNLGTLPVADVVEAGRASLGTISHLILNATPALTRLNYCWQKCGGDSECVKRCLRNR